jgi:chitinase
MSFLLLVCVAVCWFPTPLGFVHADPEVDELSDFAIAGYLPDYRFYINVNITAPFLTDLLLFSAEPRPHIEDDDSILSSCCLNPSHYEKARQAVAYKQEQNPDSPPLKLWLTVGGGGRSQHFHLADRGLVDAIAKLAHQEQLNGVDFNCEYFASLGALKKYYRWLEYAIPILQSDGLHVSIALHAGTFLPPILYGILDRIHLMTYDFQPGYHADFRQAQNAVDQLIQSGCDSRKILLGIPAYSRHTQNPARVKTFAELLDGVMEQQSRKLSHEQIMKQTQYDGYRCDSPSVVDEKVQYAKEKRLGGVFFWELGQDKQVEGQAEGGYLLEAAAASKITRHFQNSEMKQRQGTEEL